MLITLQTKKASSKMVKFGIKSLFSHYFHQLKVNELKRFSNHAIENELNQLYNQHIHEAFHHIKCIMKVFDSKISSLKWRWAYWQLSRLQPEYKDLMINEINETNNYYAYKKWDENNILTVFLN